MLGHLVRMLWIPSPFCGFGLLQLVLYYGVRPRRMLTPRESLIIHTAYAPIGGGLAALSSGGDPLFIGLVFTLLFGYFGIHVSILLPIQYRNRRATRMGYITLGGSRIWKELHDGPRTAWAAQQPRRKPWIRALGVIAVVTLFILRLILLLHQRP